MGLWDDNEFDSSMSRLPIVLLFSIFGLVVSSLGGNDTDQFSLLDFKSRIANDPLGILSSWNETTHFCLWRGITCDSSLERVTILDLQSLKLEGPISRYIGNLSFLRELHLQGNNFNQGIPPEIGYLSRLEVLNLNNNSLIGSIPPSLSNCSRMTYLALGNNELGGGIPIELGSLTKLQVLLLYHNHLTGQIPPAIGNLSSLNAFYAQLNNLYGRIPESLGQLKNIQELVIGGNNFTGMIPPSIFNLSTLTLLEVVYNRLEGSLPSNLFTRLPNLQAIGLGYNFISGSIPGSISNASNMERFRAAENQLTGIVPSLEKLHNLQVLFISANQLGTGGANDLNFLVSLSNASRLQRLAVRYNQFGGELPEVIGNFSADLTYLTLGGNEIFGTIPSSIGKLVNLEVLDMSNSLLSGSIPSGIGKLQKLVILYLNGNKLTGNIPSSIGNLTGLTDLLLGDNLLLGEIPPSLGMLQALYNLSLSGNKLIGSVPREIFSLSSLSIGLDLSRNNLTGSLPVEVGNLNSLGLLDISENSLTGEIPATLGDCIGLEQLSFAGNNLQGVIPSSLSSLTGLQVLDLSRNNFSGEIPLFLEGLHLQILNLSDNNLEGSLPVGGVFQNASAVSIAENSKLCGGIPELKLPKCSTRKKNNHLTMKVVISVVSVLLCLALFILFLHRYLLKKRTYDPSSDSFDELLPTVSYHSLRKTTNGFSEANLIGVGAFGTVYKGIIGEGEGRLVFAVKVVHLFKHGAASSFLAECEVLRNVRHRNLVKIITACSSADTHGNDFKGLVYEYMPNGSLENWLHPANLEGQGDRGMKPNLSLLKRLKIAIDVASALDYLHHQCENPIVHCDLKPSNILLDKDMVAHVGDFRLARFITGTVHTSSIGVRGSTGYVSPVSSLGDVYSYGILLLELFTGKRPTDEMFDECMSLRGFCENAISGRVELIMDPALLEEISSSRDHQKAGKTRDCLVSMFLIGVACSAQVPKERMTIRLVMSELCSITDKLIKLTRG